MEYLFTSDEEPVKLTSSKPWHILSVDDDPMIHEITKLVISDIIFDNEKIKFSSANSAKEAIEYINNNDDIALILLDIVMEKEDSGFDVAEFVRNTKKNFHTRVVIRSGQPGAFLKEEVVQKYGIDGFTEKTDLTKNQLTTILYSSIRTYRDIRAVMDKNISLTKENTDLKKEISLLKEKDLI